MKKCRHLTATNLNFKLISVIISLASLSISERSNTRMTCGVNLCLQAENNFDFSFSFFRFQFKFNDIKRCQTVATSAIYLQFINTEPVVTLETKLKPTDFVSIFSKKIAHAVLINRINMSSKYKMFKNKNWRFFSFYLNSFVHYFEIQIYINITPHRYNINNYYYILKAK